MTPEDLIKVQALAVEINEANTPWTATVEAVSLRENIHADVLRLASCLMLWGGTNLRETDFFFFQEDEDNADLPV